MLNYAKRQQYIDRNPVCDVSFLDEGEGNMRIVSHWEQRLYLSVASPLVHDVALLIVETGMRPEEVFNLLYRRYRVLYIFMPGIEPWAIP